MTNDVAVQNNGGEVATQSANPFKRAAGQMNVPTGMPFLAFSGKTGKYTVGQDKKEVPYDTRYAVNMNEFKRGWICWLDGSVEEELMVRVLDGDPVAEKDLTDHAEDHDEDGNPLYDDQEGWSYQISVQVRDVETGEQALFKISSKSGVNQLSALLNSYADNYEMHTDEVMVVEIDAEEFEVEVTNDKGRKVKHRAFKPIFDIVEWLDEDELNALLGMDSDAENQDEDDLRDDDDGPDQDQDADEQEEAPRKNRGTGKISDKKRGRR